MSSKVRGERGAALFPIGSVVVVDEASHGFSRPTFWVGVVEDHPALPSGELMGLPIIRLTHKPEAAHLTDWWVIGKAYQHEARCVLSLDEARVRFGDQPEFSPHP